MQSIATFRRKLGFSFTPVTIMKSQERHSPLSSLDQTKHNFDWVGWSQSKQWLLSRLFTVSAWNYSKHFEQLLYVHVSSKGIYKSNALHYNLLVLWGISLITVLSHEIVCVDSASSVIPQWKFCEKVLDLNICSFVAFLRRTDAKLWR